MHSSWGKIYFLNILKQLNLQNECQSKNCPSFQVENIWKLSKIHFNRKESLAIENRKKACFFWGGSRGIGKEFVIRCLNRTSGNRISDKEVRNQILKKVLKSEGSNSQPSIRSQFIFLNFNFSCCFRLSIVLVRNDLRPSSHTSQNIVFFAKFRKFDIFLATSFYWLTKLIFQRYITYLAFSHKLTLARRNM